MYPSCAGEGSLPCFNGCFPSPFLASEEFHNTSKSSVNNVTGSYNDFAAATASSLHPHTQFTNHEALPSLQESYINFVKVYPPFSKTSQVDEIRAQEYQHLNLSNTCFDYTGNGLFSYAQFQRSSWNPATSIAAASSSSSPYSALEPHFFDISYKSVNLHSQILYGGEESELESRMRERIMAFMNISEADYTLVFTANEVSAFKLVADSFQFHNGDLLTVYDHSSEALDTMIESCKKQGVHVLSAEFSWPNLGIHWRKLKKLIMNRREKKKRGLFVFPLHSRVTGAPYSYSWMFLAQENGWHVLLDACALGPKEMDSLGLSLFKPDFLICSFYKAFGENPSGFGCLFVKKSSVSALKDSSKTTSIGIVSLVPAFRQQPQLPPEDCSVLADEESEPKAEIELHTTRETSAPHETEEVSVKQKGASSSSLSSSPPEIVELNIPLESSKSGNRLSGEKNERLVINCKGLDHADSVGRILISSRGRYLINWLVNALMSLQHPHPENGLSLIRIYGPKINSQRGHAVAFNLFDWIGEKIDPALVQKLADRNSISLGSAFLQNIRFSNKNEEGVQGLGLSKKTRSSRHESSGIFVVTATLGFLTNFEDTYRLWAFLSRFLDADFVEKEKWRYTALNQMTIEV